MKIKVQNISFIEYYNLKDRSDYNYYLQYAEIEPKDFFKVGELKHLTFGTVKDIQELYNSSGFIMWNDYFKELEKLTGSKQDELSKIPLFDLHRFRLYLYDQIDFINDLESTKLSHKPDADEQIAGIEEFGKYKSFVQFDNLAGGDILKYNKIREEPYMICFTKMLLDAERNEFQERLNKLKTKK
jgi:hypothetical protein